ncbi:MAG: MmgE/PrpD family protein [Methanobacteriaceae archaeon]|nr:MmgE/PrpD family protein [Methanobacteriaceae archaeon]MDP2837125.1 MmgE/PrpD family protein [Methanobacteriaceae archaeon]MDP3485650.1 MmgE/PrpD family protein [Methanobacteriaceae archaeon]MDP3624082.1 MmgE/PrpD family protein [Methanobacteriaceae archaeon]
MITKELANFIVSLKYEDIPDLAIEKAKLCFLDFLGVSIRGSQEKSSLIAFEVINPYFNYNSKFKSTIIGHGNGAALNAGFLNGISAHCLDLDDGHRLAQLHPGCAVIPSVLALAEEKDKTGKEFLEAIVAGYEVAIVLGKAINPSHRSRGFHSTGTIGTFAAAAASSKILNLDLEETINALGLSGTQAAGLLESDHAGTMGKHLHAGRAVQSGMMSALLSQKGFTGAESIVEGKEGFFKALGGEEVFENSIKIANQINSELGQFHIQNVYLKKYPVCRHLHSTIDSAVDILNEINISSIDNQKIKKITVQTYKTAAEHDNYCPMTLESVRQSLPISLAIVLNKGELTLENIEEFENNLEFKNKILKIADKVEIQVDYKLNNLQPQKRPSRVIIEFEKGLKRINGFNNYNLHNNTNNTVGGNNLILEKTTFLPKGEPENPFTKQEIFEKFYDLNPDFKSFNLNSFDHIPLLKIRDFMIDFKK